MTFDKHTYWKNRKNGKRGQGEVERFSLIPNSDVPVTINDNVIKYHTRANNRKDEFGNKKNVYKKKGFIAHIPAIRKVRNQHGKKITKYYPVEL